MRALQLVRLYALAVFFLVVVGGIVLKPGARQSPQQQASGSGRAPVVAAGVGP